MIFVSTRPRGQITFWRQGSKDRFTAMSLAAAATRHAELFAYLARHGIADPVQWLDIHAPQMKESLARHFTHQLRAAAIDIPPIGKGWAGYGHIGVIRAINGVFTCALGIHGATQHIPGSHRTLAAAQAALDPYQLRHIIHVTARENAGEEFKLRHPTHPPRLLLSASFRHYLGAASATPPHSSLDPAPPP